MQNPNLDLSDFYIHQKIGFGGFGQVYLATKRDGVDKGHRYAIKMMSKEDINKKEWRRKLLLNEATLHLEASKLPFIIHFYGSFTSFCCYNIVMELAKGCLLDLLNQNLSAWNEHQIKFYFSQMCLAIDGIHSLNIVHCDIKPENFLVGTDNYLRLSDFGLAQKNNGKLKGVVGPPGYIPPECLDGRTFSFQFDFFSLGACLHEMFARRNPFRDAEKANKNVMANKSYLSHQISEKALTMIRHLLYYDPNLRISKIEHIKQNEWMEHYDYDAIREKKIAAPYQLKNLHVIGKSQKSIEFHFNGPHKLIQTFDQHTQTSNHMNQIENRSVQCVIEPTEAVSIEVDNATVETTQNNCRFINVPEEKKKEELLQLSKKELRDYYKAFIIELSNQKYLCAMNECASSRYGGRLASIEACNNHILRTINKLFERFKCKDCHKTYLTKEKLLKHNCKA